MKFGQYELLERIAIGGMAEVYKGRVVGAEGFEKLVAIKRIQPDLIADERFVTMLLTEARIHSALSHRNIVQIHDLGISEEGEYFIVLEYVEGYDLRAIMESINGDGEIIPEALSLHIAAEVAQGLHFAHELSRAGSAAAGADSSRRLAVERAHLVRGRGQARRLRAGQAAARSVGGRLAQGQPDLHVARAGAPGAARSAHRRLLAGRVAVRVADRQAAARDHRRDQGLGRGRGRRGAQRAQRPPRSSAQRSRRC